MGDRRRPVPNGETLNKVTVKPDRHAPVPSGFDDEKVGASRHPNSGDSPAFSHSSSIISCLALKLAPIGVDGVVQDPPQACLCKLVEPFLHAPYRLIFKNGLDVLGGGKCSDASGSDFDGYGTQRVGGRR
jgi:hypothetical protein